MHDFIEEFMLLKYFVVFGHVQKTPKVLTILRKTPFVRCMKWNVDGPTCGYLDLVIAMGYLVLGDLWDFIFHLCSLSF